MKELSDDQIADLIAGLSEILAEVKLDLLTDCDLSSLSMVRMRRRESAFREAKNLLLHEQARRSN